MAISYEARLEIQDLYSRYNHAVDILCSASAVAECFSEDGTYDHGRLGQASGREDISMFMQRAIDDQNGGFQHWNGNVLVEGDDCRAQATAYVITVDGRGEKPEIAHMSIYQDELVNAPNGWRFVHRRVGYPTSEMRE